MWTTASSQLGLVAQLVLGLGFWFGATGDAAEQRSMLQMVRVPDPMASAELQVSDRVAAPPPVETGRPAGFRPHTEASAVVLEVPVPPISVKNSRFQGRGIAVAVNGADPVMLASAFALVRVVRRVFNSSMQIELFHLGPAERFSSAAAARFIAEGALRILDLQDAAAQSYHRWYDHDGLRDRRLPGAESNSEKNALGLVRKKRGWHIKPLTAMVSSFEEVLLMDADALPLQPPENFFHDPKLQPRHRGSSEQSAMRMVLFRDHVHCLTSVSAWLLMEIGLSPSNFCKAAAGQEIDSSAVVMDKSDPAVWKALHIAEALNRRWHSGTFDQDQLLAGDKDTWLIAAMLSRTPRGNFHEHFHNQEWRSPVSANPPGFLVLAGDAMEDASAGDVCVPDAEDPGSACNNRKVLSDKKLPEDSTVQTLSWHCHFDHQNLAPLYINSRCAWVAARLTTHHADLRLLCFCAPLHSGAVFLAVLHRSRQLHRMHAKLREPRRLFFARGKGWAVPGPVVAADSINSQAGGVGSNGTLPLAEFQRAVACFNGPLGTERDLAAILNAVQKTTRGGAECWEPVGEGLQAAIVAAASAIAELKDALNAGIPATASTLTTSEGPNMLYVAGQKLESIGRLEDARRAYRAALEATAHSQPQQPLRQELQTTKWSQGLSMPPEVTPVSGVDDMRATLLYHLAHAFLVEGGRAAEAVETATQAVELSPQSGKGWQILGLAHERLGTADGVDAAVRCYRRGTQAEPRVVGNWHNLALLLAQVGRWQASLDAANGGLVAVPGHAAGWVARGNAQRELKLPLAALESYQTAVEVGPRHVAGWHNMGVVLHELGRAKDSNEALRRARELEHQRP